MNNTEKVFIIIGFFVILIYFIHYFSLDSTIINLLGLSKESFQNIFLNLIKFSDIKIKFIY